MFLSSSVPFDVGHGSAGAAFTLTTEQTQWFLIGYDREIPNEPEAHHERYESVVDYWRNWSHPCS